MKAFIKLAITLVVCGLALYGAYCLMQIDSPAARGFREAIHRFIGE